MTVNAKGESVDELRKKIVLAFYREELKKANGISDAMLNTAVMLNISERTIYRFLKEN